MNILQAIDRFKWRFQNSWKVNEKDIEAYNAIIDFKDIQASKNISEHESLAKLVIHLVMLLNQSRGHNTKQSLNVLDEILSKSVYDWCKSLHEQSSMMRFNNIIVSDEYLEALRVGNITKMRVESDKVLNIKEKELHESLTMEVKEEDVIKWVENIITGIIHKYEK